MDAASGRFRYTGFLTVLIVLALALAARLLYLCLADPERFPINTVKVSASYQHITHKQLESILVNYVRSSFFTFPVHRLHADLTALNWTDSVYIERIWPDILRITLVEKIPEAIWNNAMVTAQGEIFNEGGALSDASLPLLSGPKNQQREVLQVYKKMSKILTTYGLHAASLEWSENQAWQLTLANGLQLRLGKRDLETRISRFCKAYPAVFAGKTEQLASVDLRYPRGMAVQWKK
ncbi:MAG: cell division protein FtsQ/DivIB [Tatlockia sp.]|jgi:cell division protein FtsQ